MASAPTSNSDTNPRSGGYNGLSGILRLGDLKMIPFPNATELRGLIELAKQEDLGNDDVTSRLLIDEDAIGVGTLLQKEVGIVCGLPIVEMVCRAYDERLRVEPIPGFHMEIIEGRFNDAQRS